MNKEKYMDIWKQFCRDREKHKHVYEKYNSGFGKHYIDIDSSEIPYFIRDFLKWIDSQSRDRGDE